jgi:Tfp pilus assembly protein PilF
VSAVLVGLCAVLPYLRTLGYGLTTWDDPRMVTANPLVAHPGLAAFASLRMTTYQPLGWYLYAALSRLGGGAPQAYHAGLVALHALNAALAFLIVRRFLPERRESTAAAALAVLAWAWHPVQAESVAWVSQLSDLLCASFVLSGLLAREKGRPWTGLAGFALAGLCRWKALAYPVFALALDAWRGRVRRERAAEYAGLALVLLAVAAVNAAAKAGAGYTAAFRPQEFCVGLLVQAGKLAWPAGLGPTVLLDGGDNPLGLGVFGALGAAALAVAAAVLAARRRPAAGAALAAFAAALAPAFLSASGGPVAAMDHHLYLPSLAFVPLLAALLARGGPRRRQAAALVCGALALGSWAQAGVWRDSETLWARSLEVHPLFPAARLDLAAARAAQGRPAEALLAIDDQLALYPGDADARRLRALLLARYAPDRRARARLESDAGAALLDAGRPAPAAARMKAALALAPRDPELLVNAAIVDGALGRRARAARRLRRALALAPRDARARAALARLEAAP